MCHNRTQNAAQTKPDLDINTSLPCTPHVSSWPGESNAKGLSLQGQCCYWSPVLRAPDSPASCQRHHCLLRSREQGSCCGWTAHIHTTNWTQRTAIQGGTPGPPAPSLTQISSSPDLQKAAICSTGIVGGYWWGSQEKSHTMRQCLSWYKLLLGKLFGLFALYWIPESFRCYTFKNLNNGHLKKNHLLLAFSYLMSY